MKKYLNILKQTKLFQGITEEEILLMLSCLEAKLVSYKKGDYVYHEGDNISHITILVSGNLHIQKDDYWGNRTIVSHIEVKEMFGEAYIGPLSGPIVNDVIVVEDSIVVFLNVSKLINVCSSSCRFHTSVIQNLLYSISEKNKKLVQKIGHISQRTTKEKLMSYLSEESKKHKSSQFTIPFNRRQLAEFLSVDRSAMSNELCKMRDEGLLEFHKNKFKLL